MAYHFTLSGITPSTAPAGGWNVGYRILGSGGSYTTAGPFMSQPIVIPTADAVGTLYEGYITRDCGTLESTQYFWQTPCNCTGAGYVTAPSGTQCQNVQTQSPTVTSPGYCLATSQDGAYCNDGARIYNPGFSATTLNLGFGASDAFIASELLSTPLWRNPTANLTDGPLNREGVWIDSDCDGNVDALSAGTQTTIATVFNNTGATRTIHVGVGADNQFQLVVNGSLIVDTGAAGNRQFKVWHIMPITVVPGANYINIIATGDGSVNDAMGLIVYDNTQSQIIAASGEGSLTIPFRSSSLRGTTYSVATCPSGWSLDTSSGNPATWQCVQTTYKSCNTLV